MKERSLTAKPRCTKSPAGTSGKDRFVWRGHFAWMGLTALSALIRDDLGSFTFHTDPHIFPDVHLWSHLSSRLHEVNVPDRFLSQPAGTKHKTMLEARTGVGSIKSFPRPGVKSKLATTTKSSTGLQNKTFYCETCDVHVNSETQLKQVRRRRSFLHT